MEVEWEQVLGETGYVKVHLSSSLLEDEVYSPVVVEVPEEPQNVLVPVQ